MKSLILFISGIVITLLLTINGEAIFFFHNQTFTGDSTDTNWTSNNCCFLNTDGNKAINISGFYAHYVHKLPNITATKDNWSIRFYVQPSSFINGQKGARLATTNTTGAGGGDSETLQFLQYNNVMDQMVVNDCQVPTQYPLFKQDNTKQLLQISTLNNASWNIYINNSLAHNIPMAGCLENMSYLQFGLAGTSSVFNIQNMTVFNGSIFNNPPSVTNVSILPLTLQYGNTTQGFCNYTDIDGDGLISTETYWYVNNTQISTASNSLTLSGQNFTKNSNVTFSCRKSDYVGFSNWINSSRYNVTNILPLVVNVSLSELPYQVGNTAKGNCQYIDYDNESSGGNQTYWWVNKTLITTANNSFDLSGGNLTLNSNITFSCRYNDTVNWTDWTNSSTATVGDTTSPSFPNDGSVNPSSATINSVMALLVNASDNNQIGTMISEIRDPNSIKTNYTMTLYDGSLHNGQWSFNYTATTVGTHIVVFYAIDGNGNRANTGGTLTFVMTAASTGGSGGGSSSPQNIIIAGNMSVVLSFGIAQYSFFVLGTDKKSQAQIQFKNLGNKDFSNGKLEILGDLKPFVTGQVCDIDLTKCKSEGIEVKQGQSAFLVLNGTFNDLGSSKQGVVRLISDKVFDLPIQAENGVLVIAKYGGIVILALVSFFVLRAGLGG